MLSHAEHPSRHILTAEVHARPSEPVTPPERIVHLALMSGEAGEKVDRARVAELCGLFKVEAPPLKSQHFVQDFGAFRMRWERHTEFSTYTFHFLPQLPPPAIPGPAGEIAVESVLEPFKTGPLEIVPDQWVQALPQELMVAVDMVVLPHQDMIDIRDLIRIFGTDVIVAASINSNRGMAYTDFRLNADGFTRLLVTDRGMSPPRTGRLIQRLLEIETYRIMALIAFPIARDTGRQLTLKERRLSNVVNNISRIETIEDQRKLLVELTSVASELEALAAEHSYRFGAARAYYAIVRERIAQLQEQRVQGYQTFTGFIDRRLAPAMRTCDSTSNRMDSLSQRVARASELLRTRIDIALAEQNSQVLRSMDERAGLQLRLQETVEGLSVAAMGYYFVSLIGYVAKGAKESGMLSLAPEIVMAISIPFVIGILWIGVRRVRRAITRAEKKKKP